MGSSILVIGGGFAGVSVARGLDARAEVTIVSDTNFLLFTPMLAEVAAADVDPRHIISPVRQLCPHARLVQGEVLSIDPVRRSVSVRPPFGGEPIELEADAMVLAMGGISATFGVPGVADLALPFKTISDGLRIRNRVLALLERASEQPDPELTHVAVVGAGYSGAELAAALADFLSRAWPEFYATAPPPRVTLIDAVERVVPMLPARLGSKAEQALRERGVRIILGTSVSQVTPSGVELADGRAIEAATVVWAAGVRPHPLVETLGLPTDRGRLVTDGQLRVAPGVYALGDLAAVPDGRGGTSPPTAQFALRQGKYLGRHLPELIAGGKAPSFRYNTMGQLVSLGHRNAVGLVMGVPVTGFIAWFLWRSYYLLRLPTLFRKARVAMDWSLDLLFPPDIAWLPTTDLGPPPV
jgi:NADH:ubiquinone reductase (H+-translocating)